MGRARIRHLLLPALVVALGAQAAGADTLYLSDRQANVVHQFNVGADGRLAALSPATIASAGVNPSGVAVSPNDRSVYVASGASGPTWDGDVSQYDVFASGALVVKSPFEAFAPTDPDSVGTSVAVANDSAHVYVTGCCSGPFAGVWKFDADAGGLLRSTGIEGVAGANDVVVHPALARLYVAGTNQVRRYDVEADGSLRNPDNTVATGATQLAITPNGRYLYATSGTQDVLAFSVAGDGDLTALGAVTIPSGTVQHLAASDTSVYVTETGTGVTQYDVGGDGRLAPKTPAVVDVAGAPAGIALSPDQRSAYVASYLTANRSILAQFDVGAGGGLSPKSPVSLVVGGTPEQIAVTTAGTGGAGPSVPPPPAPRAPPAPPAQPPARRIPINEILLYRRAGNRYVGFKWDARGVRTEITCTLTRESPGLCDATVEIIDLFADNVRVVHFSAARGRSRARRPTVLARGRIRLAAGRTGTIRLTLTRAGRRALRGRRTLNAWARMRVTIGSQPPLVGQVRAKLTPARARRARRRR